MDGLFNSLAVATGASGDQLKLISCLLVSYPLGSVFIRISTSQPNLRHIFNIAVTAFFLIPVLNIPLALLQLLGDVLVTYFLAAYVKGPRMPWIVFAVIMSHLTYSHVLRAYSHIGYETVDISGAQMVLTMKLTTFAWNVWDGRQPAAELDKWQTEKRVVEYPSLLAFLGYAFYFPGFLVGPSLEFADYLALIHGTQFKFLENSEQNGGKRRKLVPKGRKRVAYRKMLLGLTFIGIFATYNGSFNLGVTAQDWYAHKSFLYRVGYLQICGFVERTKYYGVWTLTEGASILTGYGFSGFSPSGKSLWTGATNVNIYNIEFPPNFKILLDSWNMKTNVWLRECIYKRVTPKGKKPGFRSSMITFTTSAFWHGIHGGYYLTFSFGGFIQTAQRLARKNIRPLFLPATYVASRTAPPPPQTFIKRVYDIVGVITSLLVLNYTVAPFMLLDVRSSLKAWTTLNWYGHGMIFGALLFFYAGGTGILKRIQARRVKAARGKTKVFAAEMDGTASDSDQGSGLVLPPTDDAAKELEQMELMQRMNSPNDI